MARASESGQAVLELIVGSILALTVFAFLIRAVTVADRELNGRRFKTKESIEWSE